MNKIILLSLVAAYVLLLPAHGWCEDVKTEAETKENKVTTPKKRWNDVNLGFMTLNPGVGYIIEDGRYDQDETNKKQIDLRNKAVMRDARFMVNGRFKNFPRLTLNFGYMYQDFTRTWLVRQSGLIVDVPEAKGQLYLGRFKEGYSTSKIMVGYYGWTAERAAANDAFIPILADGVKWLGTAFENRFAYSVGAFSATIFGDEPYDRNRQVYTARAIWLPFGKSDPKRILHIALQGRYGTDRKGQLEFRSKPESFMAHENAVSTGRFDADSTTMGGLEVYYSPGPLMFGMEYNVNKIDSESHDHPIFHGGEIFGAYLFDGSQRPYSYKNGAFGFINPANPVTKGGLGTLEFVLKYSSVDLDSKDINGGKFRKITPMFNWYLSEQMRLEFTYGYSELDRRGDIGTTQYFATRLQFLFI